MSHGSIRSRSQNLWIILVPSLHLSSSLDEATYGKEGYGAKASDILIKVRGKDFRREKTKKKRGNYSGGRISMEVKSTRFDDDE